MVDDIRSAWDQAGQYIGSRPASHTPFSTTPVPGADPGDEEEKGFTDYLGDIPRGFAAGGLGFVQSVGQLADHLAEAIGLDLFDDDDYFNPIIKPKTLVGDIVKGLTQFALGFIPFAGLAGNAARALQLGKLGATALRTGAGVAADFVGFGEIEGNLSQILVEHDVLRNPVTDFLAAKEDDHWAERRFKNALEGLGLGAATEGIFAAFKGYRGIKAAAGDAAKVAQIAQQTAADIEKAGLTPEMIAAIEKGKAVVVAPQTVKHSLTKPFQFEGLKDQFFEPVRRAIEAGEDPFTAIDTAFKTNLNLERLSVSDDLGAVLRNTADLISEAVNMSGGATVSQKLTASAAEELALLYGTTADGLMKVAAVTEKSANLAAEWTALRILRNHTGLTVLDLARQWKAAKEAGSDTLDILTKSLMDAWGLHGFMQYNTELVGTHIGRALNAGNIVAGFGPKDIDVRDAMSKLERVLNGKTAIVPEQLVHAILGTEGDPKVLSNIIKWVDTVGEKALNKAWGVHNELWINGLLSGLRTLSVNVVNQVVNSILLPLDRIAGGLVGMDRQAIKSGNRLLAGLVGQVADAFHMWDIGARVPDIPTPLGAAWKVLKTEQPILETFIEKGTRDFAIRSESDTIFGHLINAVGKLVRMPTRLMGATDEFFKVLNYRNYLRDEAIRIAESKGLKGADIGLFVEKHMAEGFDKLGRATNEDALHYAQRSTMTHPLMPGTIGKSLSDFIAKHPSLRVVAPFIRVPTNIFRAAVQYTPGINFLQKEFRQKWLDPDPLVRADVRGRFALGGGFWFLATTLALSGKITGNGPSNKEERDVLMQSGWKPNSLRFQNDDGTVDYVAYNRLEPFGMLMSLAADFVETAKYMSDDDATAVGQAMVVALANSLTSKTYLTGIREAVNLFSSPDRFWSRFATRRIGSYVPNFLAGLDDDEYLREVRSILDGARHRIPGLSDDLPPKRNLFGEPVPDTGSAWNPFQHSRSVPDEVKEELARLMFGFGKPSRNLEGVDLTLFRNDKGQDAYDRLQELHGEVRIFGRSLHEALTRLVQSEGYRAMPAPTTKDDKDNPRVRAIQGVIADYREQARRQLHREFPEIRQTIRAVKDRQRVGTTPTMQLFSR